MTTTDELLARARGRIDRVRPESLAEVSARGGLVIDIRPAAQRGDEGSLGGALVIERNVLEWRLDPDGAHRVPQVTGHDQQVVLVCSEGYASSLAAASLADLGFVHVGDLEGGYLAWRDWNERKVVQR